MEDYNGSVLYGFAYVILCSRPTEKRTKSITHKGLSALCTDLPPKERLRREYKDQQSSQNWEPLIT